MPGFVDTDPSSPFVFYETADGQRIPLPRPVGGVGVPSAKRATDAAPTDVPPEIQMPAEDVTARAAAPVATAPTPPAEIEMPAEDVPPRAPAPAAKFSDMFAGASQPPFAPTSAATAPTGTALPGVGYVPAGVAGVNAPVVPAAAGEMANPPTQIPSPEEVLYGEAKIAQERSDKEQQAAEAYVAQKKNADFLYEQQQQAAQQQAATRTQQYLATVDKLAKTKIDPGRLWHDMSTPRKIGTVMMALVSGFGSVLKKQGDKNPALDMIMDSIRQDVAMQMDQRDKLGADVGRQRDALDAIRQQSTSREAEYRGRVAILAGQQADEFDRIAKASSNKMVAYEYAQAANDMRAQGQAGAQAGAQQEFNNQILAAKTAAEISKMNAETAKLRGGIGGGAGAGVAGKTGTGGRYASLDQIDPKYRASSVRMPDGSWVITKDKDAAKAADQQLADSRVMVTNIDRVLAKLSDPDLTTKLESKAFGDVDQGSAVVKQEMNQLLANAKNFLQLGAISESDMSLIQNLGADSGQVTSFIQQIRPKLENWRRGIIDDAATRVQQYGIDVDKATYGEAPATPKAKTSDDVYAELTSEPAPTTTTHRRKQPDGSFKEVVIPTFVVPTKESVEELDQTVKSEKQPPDVALATYRAALKALYDQKAKMEAKRADLISQRDAAKKDKRKYDELDAQAKAALQAEYQYDEPIAAVNKRIQKINSDPEQVAATMRGVF